jgi:hypothetical protein
MAALQSRIVTNALAYWAAIFALGFVLGTLRTLWLAPLLGKLSAVLIEVPLILTASWFCARALHARWPLPDRGSALAMGGLAFAVLMGAELLLGVLAFGLTPGEWLKSLGDLAGAAGLAGQIGFALIPAWAWVQPRST